MISCIMRSELQFKLQKKSRKHAYIQYTNSIHFLFRLRKSVSSFTFLCLKIKKRKNPKATNVYV